MAIGPDKRRMQVVVPEELAVRIEELADLMGWSVSGMSSKLLEEAMKDNEWVIRHLAVPVRRGFERWSKRAAKGAG